MRNFSGADMRCPKCNRYTPDRCICNGPSIEERRASSSAAAPVEALPPLNWPHDATEEACSSCGLTKGESRLLHDLKRGEMVAVSADRAQQGEPVACPHCGTHEVELLRRCHNSSCPAYADEESIYKGWKSAATKAAAPVCPTCKGNDQDAPCAYPSQGKPGCLRDARLAAAPADAKREAERLYRSWSHQQPNRCQLAPWYRLDDESKAEWIAKAAAPVPDTGIPKPK